MAFNSDSATAPARPYAPAAAPRHSRPGPARSLLRYVLLGFGGFLLAAALLVPWLVYPVIARLPVDPQQEQALAGKGATVLFPDAKADGGARVIHDASVRIETYTARSPGEQGDDNHVVWDLATRTQVEGVGLLNARVERVSLDRHTSEPVNCCGDRLITDVSHPEGTRLTHKGRLNFPFNTQKHDYQLWDVVLNRTRTAVYQGEERREGVTVYKFVSDVPLQTVGTMDLPGALFGLKDPSVSAVSQYSSKRTFWIEPNTAAVVSMHEEIVQQFTYQGRVLTAMRASLDQTPNSAKYRNGFQTGALLLPWLRGRVAIVLVVLGLLLIVAGLVVGRRRPAVGHGR